eukprot:2110409-Pleurochrysis_carterae.AAC.1
MELADGPIYQEVRRRGEKMIRDLHKPPEGGDSEGGVARGMIIGSRNDEEEEESSDMEAELERQEGRREIEKGVHSTRNGEI